MVCLPYSFNTFGQLLVMCLPKQFLTFLTQVSLLLISMILTLSKFQKLRNQKELLIVVLLVFVMWCINLLLRLLPIDLKKFYQIISDTQSTFVHGRLIIDNVLVAFETMHHINQKKAGNRGEMMLKLDMSKTYDRVEWSCLDKIMEKLGFDAKWRNLLLKCISIVTYSIRINGKPHGHIVPGRGLRQGDPLSPYLFLLCVEGLSAMIKKAINDGSMEGVVVCTGGPKLSNLFFADYSLIFCKASLDECDSLQWIFHVYEAALGQQLNRAKASLFFSSNTYPGVKEEIKNRFGA